MLYYTIVPTDELFDDSEENETSTSIVEVQRSGMTMLVAPTTHGRGQIQRLISSNPADYLKPELQPGSEIFFAADDVIVQM